MLQRGDSFAEDLCGEDAGVEDGAAVGGSVAAVYAAAGEVDADIALFEIGDPWTEGEAVPWDYAPRGGLWEATEDNDIVTLGVKVTGEEMAYLSGATWDDDLHSGLCPSRRLGLLIIRVNVLCGEVFFGAAN